MLNRMIILGIAGALVLAAGSAVRAESGFTPDQLSGLSLWLEADVGVTKNVNDRVSGWADQSVNGRDATQGTSANQPLWVDNVLNGKPVLRFEGGEGNREDFMTFGTFDPDGLQEMTIFLVSSCSEDINILSPYVQRAAIFWDETASWGCVHLTPLQKYVYLRFGTGVTQPLPVDYVYPSSIVDDFKVTVSKMSGFNDYLYVEGEHVLTNTQRGQDTIANCQDIGNIARGWASLSGQPPYTYFPGEIAEVIVYNRALTDSEREGIEEYLGGKYFPLTVSVPANATEGDGTLVGEGTVSIPFARHTDLLVSLSSSDETEVMVPASVTITAPNTSATFDVDVMEDAEVDGTQTVTVTASAPCWGTATDTIDVQDNDAAPPGITVDPTSGLETTEAGGTATFTVVLDTQPTHDVTIGLSSDDTSEGTVDPAELTFTLANWSDEQTVTVTGKNDDVVDGDIAYTIITAPATSGDSNYDNRDAADVSVTNMDDDFPTDGLAVWFKADAGVTKDGNNRVSGWADQSGGGRNASQGTAANQPLWVDSVLNSKPVLRFNGTDEFMTFTYDPNGLTGMTMFIVGSCASDRNGGTWGVADAPLFWNETASWGCICLSPFQTNVQMRFPDLHVDYTRPSSFGTDFSVTAGMKEGANVKLYVGGVSVASDTGAADPTAKCQNTGNVARGHNNNTYFPGDIAEVLVYGKALTDSERQSVEGYLGGKYFPLTVNVPASATEGDGILAGEGTVSIQAARNTDLVVSLSSSDTSEVTVPASVTITAGNTSAAFDITIVDDAEVDGTQTVTVTAEAPCRGSGTDTMDVLDNDGVPAVPWVDTSWGYRLKVVVDAAKVPSDQTGVPILLDLSRIAPAHSFWSHVRADGGDLVVTALDTTTRLPLEVVSCDTTGKTGEVWFKADLSASVDTEFYVYYGNASASQPGPGDTYGSAGVWANGFVAVWHLEETSGTHVDSTANGNNATVADNPAGTVNQDAAGKVGGADEFDGTDDSLEVPHDVSLSITGELTLEAWIRPDPGASTEGQLRIVHKRDGVDECVYGMFFRDEWEPPNPDTVGFRARDTASTTVGSTGTVALQQWSHAVVTFEDAADTVKFYINGALDRQVTNFTRTIGSNIDQVEIGGVEDRAGRTFLGRIDEARISNEVRDGGYVQAQYNMQSGQGTFWKTVGGEEGSPSGAPSIVTHPSDQTVAEGETATFSVEAAGTEPLSYQWNRYGSPIPGATGPSYTTPATTRHDSTEKFTCTVTNAYGSTTSNAATLTVTGGIGTGDGLSAVYYDNMDFTGTTVERIDATVDFDWGAGSPDPPSIGADTFSAVWTGSVEPYCSDTYTFYTVSDDGVRLWVGDWLLVDNWTDHAAKENSAAIVLAGGQKYPIKMEYYENGANAVAKLYWSSASTAKEVVPQTQLYSTWTAPALAIVTPAESATSPAWVEGAVASGAASVWVTVGTQDPFEAVRETSTRWFADDPGVAGPLGIPLTSGASTDIVVTSKDANEGVLGTVNQSISWSLTDLAGRSPSWDSMTVRKGDKLLLTATGTGTTLEIDAYGTGSFVEVPGGPGSPLETAYDTEGTFTPAARVDGENVGSMTVMAVELVIAKPVGCWYGHVREKDVPVTPVEALDGPPPLAFMPEDPTLMRVWVKARTATGVSLSFDAVETGTSWLQARIGGAGGPVALRHELHTFDLTYLTQSESPVFERYADGDMLVGNAMHMDPNYAGHRIRLWVWGGGALFEETGTTEYILETTEEAEGEYLYYLVTPGGFGHAHEVADEE